MNFADKAIVNVLAKASRPFLMIFSGIIMVRVLSKGTYGTYLQAMLIVNTLLMFTFCGIPQSMYYFAPKKIRKAKFAFRNVLLTFSVAVLSTLVLYFGMQLIAKWFSNPSLADLTIAISLLIFFKTSSVMREPMLLSYGKLKRNAQLNVLCNIIVYIPLACVAIVMPYLSAIMGVMLLSAFIEFVIYLIVALTIIREELQQEMILNQSEIDELDTVSLREQFYYAFPIGVSSYLSTVGRQFDQLIVSFFFAPADFAVYSRGAMKVPVLSTMSQTINNMLMPSYVQSIDNKDTAQFLTSYHRAIDKIAKINFPIFALLYALAPSLIIILYTVEYADASIIFRVYLVLLLLSITVYGIIPRITGNTKVLLYSTIFGVLSNVGLSLLLINYFGAVGAAVATVVSSLVTVLFLLFISCGFINVPFSKIMPWGNLGKLLIISVVASLPLYLITWWFPSSFIWLLVKVCLEPIIYLLLVLYLFGKVNVILEEDLQYINSRLPGAISGLVFRIVSVR